MKKTILLLLTIAFYSNSFCQGNLQFNKVINLEYNGLGVGSHFEFVYDTLIVPINKAWKIESAGASNDGYASIGSGTFYGVFLNNYLLITGYSSYNYRSTYPIWLSAGKYALKTHKGNTNNPAPYVSISIIEFNIVP